jgi:hypothetical protein
MALVMVLRVSRSGSAILRGRLVRHPAPVRRSIAKDEDVNLKDRSMCKQGRRTRGDSASNRHCLDSRSLNNRGTDMTWE